MRLRSRSRARSDSRRLFRFFRPTLHVLEDRLPPGSLLALGALASPDPLAGSANASSQLAGPSLPDDGTFNPEALSVLANETTTGLDNNASGSAAVGVPVSAPLAVGTASSLSSEFFTSSSSAGTAALSSGSALPTNQALAAMAVAAAAPGSTSHATSNLVAGGSAASHATNPVVPTSSPKAQANAAALSPAVKTQAQHQFDQLPLSFQANQGQFDPQVRFATQTSAYNAYLTAGGLVVDLPAPSTGAGATQGETAGHHGTLAQRLAVQPAATAPDTMVQMQLVGANLAAPAVGQQQLPGKVNYFIGSDPSQWHTNIATFGQVDYQSVYPGINLVYYGSQNQLEYDFVVNPGADPRAISLGFTGANQASLDAQGNLVLSTAAGQLVQHQPSAYQVVGGARQEVASAFVLNAQHQVSFQVGAYDSSRPLVIDPVLTFSTFLGGISTDRVYGLGLDAAGNVYMTGHTASANFPILNGYQMTYGGGAFDAFVSELSPDGSTLLYSTFLGGTGDDEAQSIAVDAAGNAYVTGITASTNFPTTPNALRTTFGGVVDDFVTAVGPGGNTLSYSTYLGGNGDDEGGGLVPGPGIATDGTGKAYVTGYTTSTNFPATPGAYQTTYNPVQLDAAFLTVLDTTQSGQNSLVYSTYINTTGAMDDNEGVGVAVDANGIVYMAGYTNSRSFPTTPGVIQPANAGSYDNIIMEFDVTQSGTASLLACTYLGGGMGVGTNPPDDSPTGMALDSLGNVYLAGATDSTDYPVTSDAYQPALAQPAIQDAFLSVLSNDLSTLLYSTYIGGSQGNSSGADYAGAVATYTDPSGQVYASVAGATVSSDFPVLNSIQPYTGTQDAFVAKFAIDTTGSGGTVANYATLLGGTGVLSAGLATTFGPDGSVYAGGSTGATDFPTTPGAYQTTYGGGIRDGWAAQLTG